jgi:hypothetical protein
MNVNGYTYYVRLYVTDTDDRNRTILIEDIPLHDLNVGDTLKVDLISLTNIQITELMPDGRGCKAKVINRGTYAEKRHMIGMSTFGSNATQLIVKEESVPPSFTPPTINQPTVSYTPIPSLDLSENPNLADFQIKKPTAEEPAKIYLSEMAKLSEFGGTGSNYGPNTSNVEPMNPLVKPSSPSNSFVGMVIID